MLINLENAETIELIEASVDIKCNIIIKMCSGNVINSYYDDIELAKSHYNKMKNGLKFFIENTK